MTSHKPLARAFLTPTGERRLPDPFISQVQERLGELYQKKGSISEAINCYRMSTGGEYDRTGLRPARGTVSKARPVETGRSGSVARDEVDAYRA